MADDTDEDVPLLNDDADDPLITLDGRPPQVEAVFVVTFDVKSGKSKTKIATLFLFDEFFR